jgi:imidazolonepropionase-like amidohydrolase
MRFACLAAMACLLVPAAVHGQEKAVAFVGAELLPIAAPPIPAGTVVVAGGKIVAVGPSVSTPVPARSGSNAPAG